ncbi:MAG: ABC transporter substrate-binding protein [Nitrospira sp.]|jgi:phospholipid transport system substrate-binding protein|nr:ABC transporter substrate-binding protein [Nitrospira sp.]MBP6606271.1 ABC transporter substrate-binding protein [Nitrospira sp.]HQY59672.1 ABC transporter substrate-binding protein [Nitrospira sp.]HRA97395.1 ABC transporter substrate-binding protein [Nitrospira sp.]
MIDNSGAAAVALWCGLQAKPWRGLVVMIATTMLMGLTQTTTAWSEQGPTETVKGTVSELLYLLKELKDPSRSEARREEIEQVIRHHVDYEDMAKRSLGASWGQLSHVARREYVGLFVQLLRDALANRMVEYSGERISYLSEQRKHPFAEVKTRLVGEKVDTFIDFRLVSQDGRWLVYDAVMDGGSLVASYHAQFASIIRDASCAQLMERIKAKTLVVKLFEKSGS